MSLFEYMNQDQAPKMGLSQLIDKFLSRELSDQLSSKENSLLTRTVGGTLGMFRDAAEYDYPDTPQSGVLTTPQQQKTGLDEANQIYLDGGFPALLSYYGPKVTESIASASNYATDPIIPSPLEVMRKLGLNVPDFNPTVEDAAAMLPGAGITDGYVMGRDMSNAMDSEDYTNAALLGAGSALMYGSELLPGIIGSTARKAVKSAMPMANVLKKAPADDLVVANKYERGTVTGKRGDLHFNVMKDDMGDLLESGFADASGKFYSRNDALDYIKKSVPNVKGMDETVSPRYSGLDSKDLNFARTGSELPNMKNALGATNTITKSAAIDASDIFGAGAKKVKYVDPPSGGYIEILQRENGPSSVLDLQVPEEYRRQGIGKLLQESAINDNPKLMGQVSSKYAAKSAYDLGRRPFDNPTATMDDVLKSIDQDSSVNMIIDKTEIPGGQLPSIEEKRAKISALRAEANAQRFGYDIDDPVQSNAANISSAAKKHFGVTSNPSETGYILPDGTRLDLSGRHNAGGYVRSGDKFMAEPGKPDYLANSRNTDHRELFDVEGIKESDHQWGAVEQFLTETGAIRYIPDQGISIIKGQPVSDRQLKSIVNDFRKSGNPLNVDIDPVGGWSKSKSKYFERPTFQDVKDFINLNND